MKTVVLFAALLAFLINAQAQGLVVFSNSGGERVYVCDETGVYPVPAGTQYRVALYYAADGITDEAQFVQLGAPASFGPPAGYFSGGERSAPTATPGGWGMFQVRGWESAYGNTYEEAFTGGIGKVGKSNIIRVNTSHPDLGEPPTPIAVYDLHGFVIASPTCIPEPLLMHAALVISILLLCLCYFKRHRTLGR